MYLQTSTEDQGYVYFYKISLDFNGLSEKCQCYSFVQASQYGLKDWDQNRKDNVTD